MRVVIISLIVAFLFAADWFSEGKLFKALWADTKEILDKLFK